MELTPKEKELKDTAKTIQRISKISKVTFTNDGSLTSATISVEGMWGELPFSGVISFTRDTKVSPVHWSIFIGNDYVDRDLVNTDEEVLGIMEWIILLRLAEEISARFTTSLL